MAYKMRHSKKNGGEKMKKFIILSLILFCMNIFADDFMSILQETSKLRKEEKYQEAAELLESFIDKTEANSLYHYSAACNWAMAGNKKASFKHLNKAIELGFTDIEWLKTDKDLLSLKTDDKFKDCLNQTKENITALENSLPLTHPENTIIKLPEPEKDGNYSIEKSLQNRRSTRKYSDKALTIKEISQLLWAAYGITKPIPHKSDKLRGGFKTTPSAGATYPLEIYVFAKNVKNLQAGIYNYKCENHTLLLIEKGDKSQELCSAALNQPWVSKAAACIVYSAVFKRTTDVYGDRGRERYVCMELGHSAENVCLQATALNIGTVTVAAFSDLKVKLTTKMTRNEEALYILPLGFLE